jgi:uncharacterized damage-inducible protein DinB
MIARKLQSTHIVSRADEEDDMLDTLRHLYRYKAWANVELLTTLARLGPLRRLTVTRLAIKALSHTYVVDRIFAAHLQRKTHTYKSANLSKLPKLNDLAADIRASDQEYIKYVSELDPAALSESIDFFFTDGAPGRMSREEMLIHVINHGTGHRGQVSALMLLSAATPARDGFTSYLHATEASARRRGS